MRAWPIFFITVAGAVALWAGWLVATSRVFRAIGHAESDHGRMEATK